MHAENERRRRASANTLYLAVTFVLQFPKTPGGFAEVALGKDAAPKSCEEQATPTLKNSSDNS